MIRGFPGGSEVRIHLPVQKTPFHPWSGKIPHAARQLSPCTTTTDPVLYSPGATSAEAQTFKSLCSATREAAAMRSWCTATREEPPLTTTREKPEQQQRPVHRINEKLKKQKKPQTNDLVAVTDNSAFVGGLGSR